MRINTPNTTKQLFFVICSIVIATSFIIKDVSANSSECEDSPIPDPITQFESLPQHIILLEVVTTYNAPDHATCTSKNITYEAIKTNDSAKVISRYKSNGKTHAEFYAAKNNKISGKYLKHGIIKSFWSNGKQQAVEYYCDGFAVGFHQYFDKKGKLTHVADYTHSDYEWNKRIGVGKFRDFYQGESHWANATLSDPSQLFREVYALENANVIRKAFTIAHIFHPPWIELDNQSTIEQWTKPGDQGEVLIEKKKWHVVNNDFDYLPFTDVYQRHKQGLPGLRKPESYHPEILACPWIDEAMKLGLEDKRFLLKPVTAYDEKDIASTPHARYTACLAKPNAECLYEQAFENLKFEESYPAVYFGGFARAVRATAYLAWGKKTLPAVFNNIQEVDLTDPIVNESTGHITETHSTDSQQPEIESGIFTTLIGITSKFHRQMEYKHAHRTDRYPFLLALITLAEGRQKRGDFLAAEEVLDEVENLAPSYILDRDESKSYNLAVKAASIYAQLGEVDKARSAIQGIYAHNYQEKLSHIAVNLCKAGDKSNGLSFAELVRTANLDIFPKWPDNKIRKISLPAIPYVAANLAWIELACGDKNKAISSFKEILKSSDKPVKCSSDYCGNPYEMAIKVRRTVLDAGLLNLVWEPKPYDDPVFSLDIALQRSKTGDTSGALSQLDNLSSPNPAIVSVEAYKLNHPLVRAQILTLMGRTSEAAKELSNARQVALNERWGYSRTWALIELAKVYLALKNEDSAKSILNEIFSNPATKAENIYHYPYSNMENIVKLLTEIGLDQESEAVATAALDSGIFEKFSQIKSQAVKASRIMGKQALQGYSATKNANYLKNLTEKQPILVCLKLWLDAMQIADQIDDEDGRDFIKAALTDEIEKLDTSFNVSMEYQEKRLLIHDIAYILRHDFHNLPQEKQLDALNLLSNQTRLMTDSREGAKALCELGYTAVKLNYAGEGNTFFNEGTEKALKLQSRTFPIDEPALGACAFWLKSAGDNNRAKALIDELLKQMPKSLEDVGSGSTHTLLNIPIAYAEYENGEVNWLNDSRFEP